MTIETTGDDAEAAAQLLSYGFRPKLLPRADDAYATLVARYDEDPDFGFLVKRVAVGLGLRVIGASRRSGIVVTALPGSAFETRIEQFTRQVKMGEHRAVERVIHGITQLAIASLCFPRGADLADDGQTGRVRATEVDRYVRSVCDALAKRAEEAENDNDPPAEAPELERAWRAYQSRPEVAPTKTGRSGHAATLTMAKRALNYLCDRGMLRQGKVDPERQERTYLTTHRYQLHVRELAATRAYQELLGLGLSPRTDPGDGLSVTDETTLHD